MKIDLEKESLNNEALQKEAQNYSNKAAKRTADFSSKDKPSDVAKNASDAAKALKNAEKANSKLADSNDKMRKIQSKIDDIQKEFDDLQKKIEFVNPDAEPAK